VIATGDEDPLSAKLTARWTALCGRFGCPNLISTYTTLDAAYSEPHRAYHTWTHIVECLDVWERCGEEADDPSELELAVWLHDAVYRPLRSDNEARSAELALELLSACPSARVRPGRVRDLILATRHPSPPASPDEALIQDVDLHVLGAPPARYREYERQIRREYRMVPNAPFRKERARLLRSLLASEHVFRTPWFRDRFESAARANLTAAIDALG
jgi:predicted metal-dependent HD superfamily phosphohydrolase